MNKQALAFLTLFSLILMLSVYYVTLPADTTTVMNNNKTSQKAETKNDAEKLKKKADEKKDKEINSNSDVVSSPETSEQEKQEALKKIESLKDTKEIEQALIDGLKKAGYTSAVEISDNTCKVTVFDQKNDKEIAKKVMQYVYDVTKGKYLTEVSFK